MGFLGNLKWVGKKEKQESVEEVDEVQTALDVYGKDGAPRKRQYVLFLLTLLHSERPKIYGVLVILSAILAFLSAIVLKKVSNYISF